MRKWLMMNLMSAALVCAAGVVRAQDAGGGAGGQLPPAPDDPPQPANNDEEIERARQQYEKHAAEVEEAQGHARQLERELRGLAERQAAIAAAARAPFAVGDGVAQGVARVRLAGKTEKAAWLGVSTSKVPPALRHHAKLQNKYVGLVVERVEPESPADQAGLEQFDIIEKVNDQWIVNTEQFSVVLRMNQPGAEVNLSIIRQGEPQQLKATLAEKELPVLGMNEFDFVQIAPAAVAGEIPGGRANVWQIAPEGRLFFRDGNLQQLLELERLNDAKNFNMVTKDGEHTLRIDIRDGERHLTASDANGVVIFEGPVNTEEERAEVPEEIREKVDRMIADMPGGKLKASLKKSPATAPASERD